MQSHTQNTDRFQGHDVCDEEIVQPSRRREHACRASQALWVLIGLSSLADAFKVKAP